MLVVGWMLVRWLVMMSQLTCPGFLQVSRLGIVSVSEYWNFTLMMRQIESL